MVRARRATRARWRALRASARRLVDWTGPGDAVKSTVEERMGMGRHSRPLQTEGPVTQSTTQRRVEMK